jgi:hypothetical protein
MIRLFFYGLLLVAAIWATFRVLSLISKRRNRRTPGEVADAIKKHVNGTEGQWDWDHFTSIPIADERLDAIRLQCIDLDLLPREQRNHELINIVEGLRKAN